MLEQQTDDRLGRGVISVIQTQLFEPLIVAHELARRVRQDVENMLEIVFRQWLLQIFNDIELDVPRPQYFQSGARLASARVVIQQQSGHVSFSM